MYIQNAKRMEAQAKKSTTPKKVQIISKEEVKNQIYVMFTKISPALFLVLGRRKSKT